MLAGMSKPEPFVIRPAFEIPADLNEVHVPDNVQEAMKAAHTGLRYVALYGPKGRPPRPKVIYRLTIKRPSPNKAPSVPADRLAEIVVAMAIRHATKRKIEAVYNAKLYGCEVNGVTPRKTAQFTAEAPGYVPGDEDDEDVVADDGEDDQGEDSAEEDGGDAEDEEDEEDEEEEEEEEDEDEDEDLGDADAEEEEESEEEGEEGEGTYPEGAAGTTLAAYENMARYREAASQIPGCEVLGSTIQWPQLPGYGTQPSSGYPGAGYRPPGTPQLGAPSAGGPMMGPGFAPQGGGGAPVDPGSIFLYHLGGVFAETRATMAQMQLDAREARNDARLAMRELLRSSRMSTAHYENMHGASQTGWNALQQGMNMQLNALQNSIQWERRVVQAETSQPPGAWVNALAGLLPLLLGGLAQVMHAYKGGGGPPPMLPEAPGPFGGPPGMPPGAAMPPPPGFNVPGSPVGGGAPPPPTPTPEPPPGFDPPGGHPPPPGFEAPTPAPAPTPEGTAPSVGPPLPGAPVETPPQAPGAHDGPIPLQPSTAPPVAGSNLPFPDPFHPAQLDPSLTRDPFTTSPPVPTTPASPPRGAPIDTTAQPVAQSAEAQFAAAPLASMCHTWLSLAQGARATIQASSPAGARIIGLIEQCGRATRDADATPIFQSLHDELSQPGVMETVMQHLGGECRSLISDIDIGISQHLAQHLLTSQTPLEPVPGSNPDDELPFLDDDLDPKLPNEDIGAPLPESPKPAPKRRKTTKKKSPKKKASKRSKKTKAKR